MEKKLRFYKTMALILTICLAGVVMAVGVTALAKSMQFSLGTKYAPAVKVKVEMEIDGQYETIFNSANQGEVNYNASYINNVTKDTIFLKQSQELIENNTVNLRFTSYDTNYKINIYINENTTPTVLNKATNVNTPVESGVIAVDISGSSNLLGLILVSLQFEAVEEYTVSFNSQGGSDCSPITFEKGQTPALPTPTLAGYEFLGWFTSADYTNQITSTSQITASTMLYAKWNVKTYTITYKDQGGEDFSGVLAQNSPTLHVYETQTNLLSPTKANHTFQGWFLNSDCTGSAITALGATAFTDDITLYAKWKANYDFLATFSTDTNDIVNATSSLGVTLGEDFSLQLQAQNANSTAFVFDIAIKDASDNVLSASIAASTIINYNWVKTSTSNNYGTLTIPAQYLTADAKKVEITARAGTPWNNTSTTISTSGTVSISTPQQLAGLATQTNGGTTFKSVTLNLTNNIYLNDEIFLNLGNGYVKVTDGVNVAYLGDGSNGTSYQNTGKYVMGQWYSNTSGTTGSYAGTLNSWTPIGDYSNYFAGTFDGGNYEISGMYINTYSGYQGLFGAANVATIQNVSVVNGYVKSSGYVGGICGYVSATTFVNCYNFVNISSPDSCVGGICGHIFGGTTFTSCINYGGITGNRYVAGIWAAYYIGYGGIAPTSSGCYNYGKIIGNSYVSETDGVFYSSGSGAD